MKILCLMTLVLLLASSAALAVQDPIQDAIRANNEHQRKIQNNSVRQVNANIAKLRKRVTELELVARKAKTRAIIKSNTMSEEKPEGYSPGTLEIGAAVLLAGTMAASAAKQAKGKSL